MAWSPILKSSPKWEKYGGTIASLIDPQKFWLVYLSLQASKTVKQLLEFHLAKSRFECTQIFRLPACVYLSNLYRLSVCQIICVSICMFACSFYKLLCFYKLNNFFLFFFVCIFGFSYLYFNLVYQFKKHSSTRIASWSIWYKNWFS